MRFFITILIVLTANKVFAFDEVKFATSLGLEQISEGHPFNYLGINTIYVNDSLGRQMLVVSDVPGELKEMRIIHQKGFLILEVPKSDKTYSSMALVGIPEEEIRTKIKTSSVWKTFLRELNPIPNAYSNGCGSLYSTSEDNSLSGLNSYFGETVSKGAAKCIGGFLDGLWSATGGQVQDAYDGIKNLIQDPKEFWSQKVQQFENLKNFIMNFEVKMKELASNIAHLPAETKTMLICSFVGGIGTGVAISIITGGAGAAGVMLRVESYISKIMRLEKVFDLMARAGKLGHMPPEYFLRIASNKIPEHALTSIDNIAKHGLLEVVQGAMQCML